MKKVGGRTGTREAHAGAMNEVGSCPPGHPAPGCFESLINLGCLEKQVSGMGIICALLGGAQVGPGNCGVDVWAQTARLVPTTLCSDAMEKYFWTTAASCSGKILQVTLACYIQAAFYKCAPSSSAQQEQMSCVIGVQGLLHLSLLLH